MTRERDTEATNDLRRRLAGPARLIGLDQATREWHHVCIEVRCAGGGDLADDPRTPAWLRGALGRQLAEAASPEARAERPCPWQPACALDVLFGSHGKVTGGLEIPKPYVVAARRDDGGLLAEVTLFGFAADLAEVAAEALVRGLRTGLNDGDAYRPLEATARTIQSFDGVAVVEETAGAILLVTMETPLSIRRGDETKPADFGDLVSSLTYRVQGLARWQDAALDADWPALVAEGRTLRRHHLPAPTAEHWRRGSARQGRGFAIGGSRAQWLVDTPSPDLLRLLALGQTAGAGGRTAQGLGRFTVRGIPVGPA